MGISKAYGMVQANRRRGRQGRVWVVTGDGELQEGQIWESLQPVVNARMSEMTVVVDHNKLQSDSAISAVSDLGDLEAKFQAFGWEVRRCDGHDFDALQSACRAFRTVTDRPQVLIADTVKGKGVSFMEGLAKAEQTYRFHAGSPVWDDYTAATEELLNRVNDVLAERVEPPLELESVPLPVRITPTAPERLVGAYGRELLELARRHTEVVVLDADLISDCGIEEFNATFPDRFIECGIAEQHMVSAAGGMALRGLLPVVHSFACFLSARANEQIYNNATEQRKVIYTGTLAGLLPAGPGHSHQSVRDISALGAVPGLVMIEPCNERESCLAIRWAIEDNPQSSYLRLVNLPLDLPYTLPPDYVLRVGQGVPLAGGDQVALTAYGPVMLKTAIEAADLLRSRGISAAVFNCPWLNRVDERWAIEALSRFPLVVTLDDHYVTIGQGIQLAAALARSPSARPVVIPLGVAEIPICGSNLEALAYHELDAESVARKVERQLEAVAAPVGMRAGR